MCRKISTNLWDKCGIWENKLNKLSGIVYVGRMWDWSVYYHVKRCEIFIRHHHFYIFINFVVLVGCVGLICFSLPAIGAFVCVCLCVFMCVCVWGGGVFLL